MSTGKDKVVSLASRAGRVELSEARRMVAEAAAEVAQNCEHIIVVGLAKGPDGSFVEIVHSGAEDHALVGILRMAQDALLYPTGSEPVLGDSDPCG